MVLITEQLIRKRSEHNECLIGTLEELALHQEDIEKIEHIHDWCRDLKILLLQSNLISKIENLNKLKKLVYLNLSLNNIEKIENLSGLESLEKLDLTLNFIGELTSIESLKNNYNLKELILTGNPCCDYPSYHEFVIGTLPQLLRLDCAEIMKTDKLQVRNYVKQYRELIVKHEVLNNIKRDEQKIRVQQQRQELEERMSGIDDEEEKIKLFWNSKSEDCPETRNEISKYHNMRRAGAAADDNESKTQLPKTKILFAPDGRPYNMNQPKLKFSFKDEEEMYILDLAIYKFLDTSEVDLDIGTNYIRVNIKNKIFQVCLNEEISIKETTAQRSQLTGMLLIKAPKFHVAKKSGTKNYRRITRKSKTARKSQKPAATSTCTVREETGMCDLPELI